MHPITYSYSKKSSIFFTAFLAIIIFISIPRIITFINNRNTINWLLILAFDMGLILMLIYIVLKQLIPALTDKIALEINADGITSFVKNVTIPWNDIEKIDIRSGKTSSALYITFKYETDHGSYIRIPLGVVDGNDEEIYDTVFNHFKING